VEKNLTLENLSLDSQIIRKKSLNLLQSNISLNNNQDDQNKMLELLDEISKDLKNYDLEFRIEAARVEIFKRFERKYLSTK
jgi:DNA primase